jgi:hypothetical protein
MTDSRPLPHSPLYQSRENESYKGITGGEASNSNNHEADNGQGTEEAR